MSFNRQNIDMQQDQVHLLQHLTMQIYLIIIYIYESK